VGEAFFNRVASLMGTKPAAAIRLAAHWKSLAGLGTDQAYLLRARGVGELLQGKWDAASRSFQEAGMAAENALDRLAFQVGAVEALARTGDIDAALRLGTRLVRGLEELGEPLHAARVRISLGNTLVRVDRAEAARRWFQEAADTLDGTDWRREYASARLGLSTCALFGFGDGRVDAEVAEATFREIGLEGFADACRLNLAQLAFTSGRPDETIATLTAIRDRMDVGSTVERARLELLLGHAYAEANLFEEALGAFEDAGPVIRRRGDAMTRGDLAYGTGHVLVASGRPDDAVRHLRAAQRLFSSQDSRAMEAATLAELARVSRMTGRNAAARRYARQGLARLQRRSEPYWKTRVALEMAESALGTPEGMAGLRTARALLRDMPYPQFAWHASWIAARTSQGPTRLRRYRAMAREIFESRLLVRSVSARASYLRDKDAALREYLGMLLADGSPQAVQEAIETVVQSRSAALIDEIVSARGLVLDDARRDVLEALRRELGAEGGSGEGPAGTRRLAHGQEHYRLAARRLLDFGGQIRQALAESPRTGLSTAITLLEAGDAWFALRGNERFTLGGRAETHGLARWLWFELLAPMVKRDSSASRVEDLLEECRSRFEIAWCGVDHPVMCPEGDLWSIPWSLVRGEEAVVSLSPSFGSEAHLLRLQDPGSTVLWLAESDDLPHAKPEAQRFLERFPQARVCRSRAEAWESLREGPIDLLHVVAHARFVPANPMFSSLQFADGPIYATEIARSGARCRFAFLSACETGRVSSGMRLEPDGVVRAFLACSAQAVIASLWPLDDEEPLAPRRRGRFGPQPSLLRRHRSRGNRDSGDGVGAQCMSGDVSAPVFLVILRNFRRVPRTESEG